jgi:type IV pilus assembly protein PilV
MQLSKIERARSRGAITGGRAYRRARGFSLMEVMVALVVSTVGLLGLAKMEALALSSTSVAGSRSLAAIEASSLAAAMHANPGYWASGGAQPLITITAGAPYPIVASCFNNPGAASCIPANMAAWDLNAWSTSLNQVLPGSLATITCSPGGAGSPVTCTIQLQWTENGVAVSAQQSLMSSLAAPMYILYVQP